VFASEREHLMVEAAQELVLAHPGAECPCEVVQRGSQTAADCFEISSVVLMTRAASTDRRARHQA
jgi:hypothetical protein